MQPNPYTGQNSHPSSHLQNNIVSFLGLFYNNVGTSRLYIALSGNTNGEMMDGRDLEGKSHGLIDVLSWYLLKGAMENY